MITFGIALSGKVPYSLFRQASDMVRIGVRKRSVLTPNEVLRLPVNKSTAQKGAGSQKDKGQNAGEEKAGIWKVETGQVLPGVEQGQRRRIRESQYLKQLPWIFEITCG